MTSIADRLAPVWVTGLGTVLGYLAMVVVIFVGLFVVPYLLFVAL